MQDSAADSKDSGTSGGGTGSMVVAAGCDQANGGGGGGSGSYAAGKGTSPLLPVTHAVDANVSSYDMKDVHDRGRSGAGYNDKSSHLTGFGSAMASKDVVLEVGAANGKNSWSKGQRDQLHSSSKTSFSAGSKSSVGSPISHVDQKSERGDVGLVGSSGAGGRAFPTAQGPSPGMGMGGTTGPNTGVTGDVMVRSLGGLGGVILGRCPCLAV
jgi:hypothetical protein